jgi:hypothetical protein
MNNELRIEHYLLNLDRALQGLPTGQRAEIVTEIKSHIRDSMEKDPQADVDQILVKLGSPTEVAERYLVFKGIPTGSVRSMPGQILKWTAITIVALFALIVFSGVGAIWYLSPLIHVDESLGRVTLFGGLIDVNEKIGRVRVGGIEMNDALKEGVRASGEQDLSGGNIKLIKIPFNTAKLEIKSSTDQIMRWDCRAPGNASPRTAVDAGIMTLNLDSLNLAKCTISLPVGASTEFRGVNGKMDIRTASDNIDVQLTNGKVDIHPDSSKVYDFEVKVKNGVQDTFPHSTDRHAVKIKVDVGNGVVRKEM